LSEPKIGPDQRMRKVAMTASTIANAKPNVQYAIHTMIVPEPVIASDRGAETKTTDDPSVFTNAVRKLLVKLDRDGRCYPFPFKIPVVPNEPEREKR
jgi:hypothetical protein